LTVVGLGLRGRIVLAASALGLATLGVAFTTVALVVNRAQERQLDDALRLAATEEAADLAASDPPGGSPPVISDRPGPAANDVGPLPKYVAVYWPDGELASATSTFGGKAPPLRELGRPIGECFDTIANQERLRAVLVPIPQHPGSVLFIGVTRADLDGDAQFLAHAMMAVFAVAVAWTAGLAWWLVGRLTRSHRAIVKTAKRVSAGDLGARVPVSSSRQDPEGLGRNMNEMIDRLALLLRGQQQFIAQAAHELRSPLTTLYGELSLALRRERSRDDYRQTIEHALVASQRLKALAEDLLSLAHLGTEPRPAGGAVELDEVIGAAKATVSDEASHRSVTFELEASQAQVRGRAVDLERMLRNLLENAVRHSPTGGVVSIRARVLEGTVVSLRLCDQGSGVAPDERGRVFEPFFRGAHDRADLHVGAGLGLTIARDIARLHGGDIILLDTGSGTGACFEVRLPRISRTDVCATQQG
jgi:two-component system heavy metal sensor histidine kinase CusS